VSIFISKAYSEDDFSLRRIHAHFNNIGCEFTKKFPPIEVMYIHRNCNTFDEDKYTLMMMHQYGIDNVRGGTFSASFLTEEIKKVIIQMIRNATDKCFKCGGDHFVDKCQSGITGTNPPEPQSSVDNICESITKMAINSKYCTRCGRNTHTIEKCYAKTTLKGVPLNKFK
jgi:hypothetical protein